MAVFADGKNTCMQSVLYTSILADELMYGAGGSMWSAVVGFRRPSRRAYGTKSNLSHYGLCSERVTDWKMRVLRDWTALRALPGKGGVAPRAYTLHSGHIVSLSIHSLHSTAHGT